jgi:hypothetical protein
MSASRALRDLLLEQTAVETARRWIEEVRLELARDRRPIDGEWPGTLSEARLRAGDAFRTAVTQRDIAGPDHGELVLVAQLTTSEARRAGASS